MNTRGRAYKYNVLKAEFEKRVQKPRDPWAEELKREKAKLKRKAKKKHMRRGR